MGKKKLANRMARHVIDGTISPNQGRAVLGKKPLMATWERPARQANRAPQPATAAVKSAGSFRSTGPVPAGAQGQAVAPAAWAAPRSEFGREAHLNSNDPAARESARNHLAGLSDYRPWVPPLPGLVREARDNPDPRAREYARAALAARADGKA
jgi:hypothetical protein